MKKRFIYSNNGTLEDFTTEVNRYESGTAVITFVSATDSIYVGSSLPFNHVYFKMGTVVNLITANMSISVWDGSDFNPVVEIIDETDALSQSGYVWFVPGKNEGWGREDTVDGNGAELVTGLGDQVIYDKYWLKIDFDTDLTPSLDIDWMGQLFSNDADLAVEFPDLVRANMLAATTGNASYEPQHVRASTLIIQDLKRKNIMLNKNQILVHEDLINTSIVKVAEIIFGMLGDDYEKNKTDARAEYIERLDNSLPVIDINGNARVEPKEEIPRYGRLSR